MILFAFPSRRNPPHQTLGADWYTNVPFLVFQCHKSLNRMSSPSTHSTDHALLKRNIMSDVPNLIEVFITRKEFVTPFVQVDLTR